MVVTINLMEPQWVQCNAYPESLKGQFRFALWDAGWRDGIEVTRTILAPNIITYTFDTTANKV